MQIFSSIKPRTKIIRNNVQVFWNSLLRPSDNRSSCVNHRVSGDGILALVVAFIFVFVAVDPVVVHLMRDLPAAARAVFEEVTKFGTAGLYLVPVATLLLILVICDWRVFSMRVTHAYYTISIWCFAIIVSVGGGGLAINLIKRIIGRARPKHFEELGAYAFDPFAFKSSFAGFPSGHSTTAGSVFLLLFIFFPKWKWTWLSMALMVAASRVILGSHYVSDVLVGLIVGAGVSWGVVSYLAKRRRGFKFDPSHFVGVKAKPVHGFPGFGRDLKRGLTASADS